MEGGGASVGGDTQYKHSLWQDNCFTKHAHAHAHTHIHTFTLTHAHKHTFVRTYIHTHSHTCTYTYIHAYTQYMHTYIHTHIHALIHTIHTYTHTQAMWLMLQHDKPEDFVISTGETHSVRELVETAFKEIDVDIVYVCT